jgi:hypothetical protein
MPEVRDIQVREPAARTAVAAAIETAWKQESLNRCVVFDEGKLTERDADLVLREAYKKVK